jgi:N-acetylglutamate synthase-like GNAT family acetyltransferase
MNESQENPPSIYRKATRSDVVAIAKLLREFYSRVGEVYKIPYDHASMIVTVDDVVDRGVCIVGPTSCAGAIFYPFPSNSECLVAHVLFWYFQKRREIGIFLEILKLCKEQGATHINVASHFPKNTIGRFYKKCGLKPVETQYMASYS